MTEGFLGYETNSQVNQNKIVTGARPASYPPVFNPGCRIEFLGELKKADPCVSPQTIESESLIYI